MTPKILLEQTDLSSFEIAVRELRERMVTYPEDWDEAVMGPESPRPKERLKREKEVYAISRLVGQVPALAALPIKIVHSEEPDFEVLSGTVSYGIEHVELIPQGQAWRRQIRADMLKRGEKLQDWSFIRPAFPSAPLQERSEIENDLRNNPPGPGWVGDEVEKQWTEALSAYVKDKVHKAKRYKQFDANWLLVYDNWPVPILDLPLAGRLAQSQLMEAAAFTAFDTVAVIQRNFILLFSQDGLRRVPLDHSA
ncbi:hypothetical protein WKW79_20485 [Variovorax robiniae]|uniref:Uncharacterized protein n=1 Tax=Variovorax robiniae TaxID=1836199 RepID=A0ABU8XAS9_9BURK